MSLSNTEKQVKDIPSQIGEQNPIDITRITLA